MNHFIGLIESRSIPWYLGFITKVDAKWLTSRPNVELWSLAVWTTIISNSRRATNTIRCGSKHYVFLFLCSILSQCIYSFFSLLNTRRYSHLQGGKNVALQGLLFDWVLSTTGTINHSTTKTTTTTTCVYQFLRPTQVTKRHERNVVWIVSTSTAPEGIWKGTHIQGWGIDQSGCQQGEYGHNLRKDTSIDGQHSWTYWDGPTLVEPGC